MSSFQVRSMDTTPPTYYTDIKMIAYKRSNPNSKLDGNTVNFVPDKKVVVYIHGYATSDLEDSEQVKNALFSGTDDVDSVILLDWRLWSLRKKELNYSNIPKTVVYHDYMRWV